MIYWLIWIHFIADFIFQTDKMAINKSSSWKWLFIHVFIYSIPFCIFGYKYAAINFVAHFITDAISSRITTYLWGQQARHWFFVVIGADQALHVTALFLTIPLMEPLWTMSL